MGFEDVWEVLLDTDRKLRETAGRIRETEERIRKVAGDLERELGKARRKADEMFVDRLERQFGVMGFVFERSAEKARFGNREFPGCYAEIDVFLENRERGLAVWMAGGEAEAGDVRGHIERMGRLRRSFGLNKDWRELYGAVAAGSFPAKVLRFALDQGFYAIEYAGGRLGVREPEGGARAW
jgi:hypothetical protein